MSRQQSTAGKPRRRLSRIFRVHSRQLPAKLEGVFHINTIGIHVHNQHRDELEVYPLDVRSRDIKCVRHRLPAKHQDRILATDAMGETIYATDSVIFTGDSVSRYYFPSDSIRALTFHPMRNAYLVAIRGDRISEFSLNFRQIRHLSHAPVNSVALIPSTCSTNIYAACRNTADNIWLSVIRQNTSECWQIAATYAHPTLLTRPDVPDSLTMIYDNTIAILDMWHSRAAERIQRYDMPIAWYGAYLDSNICITSGYDQLCAFDHRYGLTSTHRMHEGASRVWYVDGKLFAKSENYIYVFDV